MQVFAVSAGISLAILAAAVVRTSAQASAALTGTVSSQAEGPMEGVVVSARRSGSTMTVSVLSDAQGRYAFPASRLEPGAYAVRIRATGYDLEGASTVDVAAGRTTQFDVRLRKTQDLAAQLTNGEWFMSWPGTTEVKNGLLNCTQCHTLERVCPQHAQRGGMGEGAAADGALCAGIDPRASAIATQRAWRWHVEPDPAAEHGRTRRRGPGHEGSRRRGGCVPGDDQPERRSQHMDIPAEDLSASDRQGDARYHHGVRAAAKETLPHDAAADSQGNVWYADFGTHVLGMLDPKSGKVTEYPLPITKPGAPQGSLDLVLDKQENIWMGTMYQGSLAKFDRKTKQFQTWGSPDFKNRDEARIAMVMPINSDVDGQVWIGGDNEYQVDVKTGEWKTVDYGIGVQDKALVKELSSYGVSSDSKNNFYGMNLNGTYIIKIDGRTKKVTPYPTPTPNAGPRRGHMDAQDRLWFAEFRGNKIGMFDTKTEKFQEWAVPTPWTNVYDAIGDRAGFAWAGGMNNDRVVRVNTKTGEVVEYLLPRMTNIRRVNVDNGSNPPAFWVGNNLGASLVRIEPVE
jgi:streptogramin lyase